MRREDKKIIELYDDSIVEEGLLRRIGSKVVGAISRPSLKSENQIHEFSKSVAYDVGKDIEKVFGGDNTKHTKAIYNMIKSYVERI